MEQQLSIFSDQKENSKKKEAHSSKQEWFIYIDGASRGNPGPAGAGIKIICNNELVSKHYLFLGKKTNNQAEYLALVLGLLYLRKIVKKEDLEPSKINIVSDSELLIKQMNGQYKVKNEYLLVLYKFIGGLLEGSKYKFTHVTRDKNSDADALANKAIDTKHKIPLEILNLLKRHEIEI